MRRSLRMAPCNVYHGQPTQWRVAQVIFFCFRPIGGSLGRGQWSCTAQACFEYSGTLLGAETKRAAVRGQFGVMESTMSRNVPSHSVCTLLDFVGQRVTGVSAALVSACRRCGSIWALLSSKRARSVHYGCAPADATYMTEQIVATSTIVVNMQLTRRCAP